MKVLHFYKTYFPDTIGGLEQAINQTIVGTEPYGVDAEVLTCTKARHEPEVYVDGHKVHRAHTNFEIASTTFSWQIIKRFKELASEFDLIHYYFPWPFMDMVHFIANVGKPCIVTYQSDIVRQKHLLKLYQPLLMRFLKSVNHIVVTSPNYIESSPVLQHFKDKTTVIPIGLEKSTYPAVQSRLKEQWKKELGDKFFLFVGVLRYYKGLHILIEAAKKARYPIVIVGAGPVEVDLKAQAERLGVTDHVHFVGKISHEDKVALLDLCYSLIFPSHLRSEAFGVSLLEGAMFGKPLISAEIGTGTTYINIENETGLVVPPADPDALAQAMTTLYDNPMLASRLGRQAYQRYQEIFTASKMGKAYAELYKTVLDRCSHTR